MNLLYPNPAAPSLYDPTELEALYIFAGRLLGKALFENITLQPQFAHFFLAFMHGNYNFINLIDDLATLDAELYKNLMFLKHYEVVIALNWYTKMLLKCLNREIWRIWASLLPSLMLLWERIQM